SALASRSAAHSTISATCARIAAGSTADSNGQILRPEIVRTVATVPSSQRSQVIVIAQRSSTLTPRDSANSRSPWFLRDVLQLEHAGTIALTQFRPSPLE